MFCLKRFLVLSFVLFNSFSVFARTLTWQDVERSVELYYPLVLAAQQDMQKARGEYRSAEGGFDPVLKAQAQNQSLGYYHNTYYDLSIEQPTPFWGTKWVTGYRKGIGNFPIYDARYQTFDQGELRAGVEVPLLRGRAVDERRKNLRSREVGVQVAEQILGSKQLEAKRESARKYWDWVSAGYKLTVAEEALNISLLRDQALLSRVKKGDAPAIDHTDNQRAVVQRRAALVAAERALQKNSLELSLYYRDEEGNPVFPQRAWIPGSFPVPVENEPPVLNPDVGANIHPDTITLDLQMKQMAVEQVWAQNQWLPRLDLYLGVSRDLGINPNKTHLPPSSDPWEFKAGLLLEFPIFFRAAAGNVRALNSAQHKLGFIHTATRDRIKTQILNSHQAITAAKTRTEYAQQEVRLAQKLEEAEKIRFQHGDSSFFVINVREQTTRDAMNNEIDALADYFKAKTEYETYALEQTELNEPTL